MIRPLAAALILLAACTPKPAANDAAATPAGEPEANMEGMPMGACDTARVADVMGKQAAQVREDARARSGARTVRVIGPGQAVTMDYRTDRLNLETDAAGVVTAVRCG